MAQVEKNCQIYMENFRYKEDAGKSSEMWCACSGCPTYRENKIPIDFQEFPVNNLNTYFNTNDTVRVH